MEQSNRNVQSTDDKLVLLRQEQAQYTEGTHNWCWLEQQINQVIAQNLLEYVNR